MTFARSTPAHQQGFTLVELMTTVAVLAVILLLAAPNLAGFVRSSKVRGAQSELISSFMLARSEAAKRGVNVGVAASAPSAGTEFSAGWTVWVDTNANGAIDAGEPIIRQYGALSGSVNISSSALTLPIVFAPTGFLTPAAAVNFKVCGKGDATKGFVVALQPVGLTDINDQAACP